MKAIRCDNIVNGYRCNRLLGYIKGEYDLKCPKCGKIHKGNTENTNIKKESVEDEGN